jgi:hypothetical protein
MLYLKVVDAEYDVVLCGYHGWWMVTKIRSDHTKLCYAEHHISVN